MIESITVFRKNENSLYGQEIYIALPIFIPYYFISTRIMDINIVQLLCLFLVLVQASSSDCNLLRFPSDLYFSDFVQAQHSIESYIIDEYPQVTADFTDPLHLQHTFRSINSERFVEGIPFPSFIKVVEEEASVHFEMWNLTTESLQNISVKYTLEKPFQCRYFSIKQFFQDNFFIHCQNTTHHRQYSITWPFNQKSWFYHLNVSVNHGISSKLFFYRKTMKAFYDNDFRVVRSNDEVLLQIYHYNPNTFPYSGYDVIEKNKDWIKEQTGLTNIDFIDFLVVNGHQGSFDIYLLKNKGILLAYNNNFYDRWNLSGQKIGKITWLIDTNIFAAVTENNLYFLSIQTHQQNQFRIVVKELAKISIKGINLSEVKSIGEFVVLAGDQTWNVFYLKENSIKFFKFQTPILLKDIVADGFTVHNQFLLKNKQFLLRKPSLKASQSLSTKITLKTSQCQQVLTIKKLSSKQVEVVNVNSELVWRNGIIQKTHIFYQGSNISCSFVTNGQTINVPKLDQFKPNLPSSTTEIMNFTKITRQLSVFVTRVDVNVYILSCYRSEPCKQINVYDKQYIQPSLISEARLNVFNIGQIKRQFSQKIPIIQKKLLINVVWNMSIFYFTHYKIEQKEIIVEGGQQSFRIFKFIEFQVIGYSPLKKKICYEDTGFQAKLVVYVENGFQNKWSHYASTINGVQIVQASDIFFSFKHMCSISSSNMKFLLYEYEGSSLNIKLIYDNENFYRQIGFTSFDNLISRRVVCSRLGLAVTNGSQIFFVSDDLVVTRTIKLSESTQNDKMSGSLLLHMKDASTTQVYNAETGFLIQSLHIPLEEMIVTKQSNTFGLTNGTLFNLDDAISFPLSRPDDFALLTCSNTHSSVSKIKKIRLINDLQLPEQVHINPLEKIYKNIWNSTVRTLQGATSLKSQILTHFTFHQYSNFATYDHQQYWLYRQVFAQKLKIILLNSYCMKQTRRPIFYNSLIIQYGSYYRWKSEQTTPKSDIMMGISNLHQNRLSIASWNQSFINFMTLQFDEKNFSNVKTLFNHCPVQVWIEDQFYLTRRIFRDFNHVYMMRYQMELWNSTYNISIGWNQFTDMPRRFVVGKPKIQIFTLEDNDGCKIQEITSESLGIDEEIKDFTIYIRQNVTFVFILTNTQVIAFKNLNQTSRFSAILNKPFVKIDVRFDMLLLVSEQDDSEVYNIIWQTFPLAGTLELKFTLVHVQENNIIGGVIMEKGVVIGTKLSLILYIFEEKHTLYSIETRYTEEFYWDYLWAFADDIQYKDNSTIFIQAFIFDSKFWTFEVKFQFSLDVSSYDKLIVSNEKEVKEYEKKPVINRNTNKENLMTE